LHRSQLLLEEVPWRLFEEVFHSFSTIHEPTFTVPKPQDRRKRPETWKNVSR
jgi:hypothetical protein